MQFRGVEVLAAAAAALLGALTLVGSAAAGAPAAAGEVKIDLFNVKFSPADITAAPGTVFVFENKDAFAHTVTAFEKKIPAGAAYFDSSGAANESDARNAPTSKWMGQGTKFSVTLTAEGAYEYFCIPHEGSMVGKITIKKDAGGGGGGGGGLTLPGFEVVSVVLAAAGAMILFVFMTRRRSALAAAGAARRGFDIYEAGILTCLVFIAGTVAFMAATAGETVPADPFQAHGYWQGRSAAVTTIAFIALLVVPAAWFALGPSSTSPLESEEEAEAPHSA
jgi:plastocyanin